ncbi:type II toxin-antitoxin system VapC family toxin [Acidianus sp. HS-5]|uniref:type II toxin-antitoxin system VapC family toxin n=1 Tax=Acidianus sp. HS-5 TaxID=2886040 RepID=UPI001F246814|nr:type II toxin-antitoxin system VapC family toxin [Acidianus sp. HS-5]BDC17349.1 hypothetical protein HS5_02390 [Acidianus sp. HS-5]
MSFLFDSSSIFEAVRLGRKALDVLKDNYTIDLAYYELGNIIWKYRSKADIYTLFKAINEILSFMNIINVKLDNEILDEAIKRNLTYYDSAYLISAKRLKVKLVSQDQDLIKNGAIRLEDIIS